MAITAVLPSQADPPFSAQTLGGVVYSLLPYLGIRLPLEGCWDLNRQPDTFQIINHGGQYFTLIYKQGFHVLSLPWVPTRARARPPRPSPRRELSCPWRRLTAWKLLSSSRLKTKITASAQPENLQGTRKQTEVTQAQAHSLWLPFRTS